MEGGNALYKPLQDTAVFREITLNGWTVTWNNGMIDVAPEFLYEKGTYFLSEMEPEKAIIYYDKCLSIDDEHVEALLFKAMTCATLKREKEANDCIEKISEINPFLLMELNELFED